jgi:hypothetical protein
MLEGSLKLLTQFIFLGQTFGRKNLLEDKLNQSTPKRNYGKQKQLPRETIEN